MCVVSEFDARSLAQNYLNAIKLKVMPIGQII